MTYLLTIREDYLVVGPSVYLPQAGLRRMRFEKIVGSIRVDPVDLRVQHTGPTSRCRLRDTPDSITDSFNYPRKGYVPERTVQTSRRPRGVGTYQPCD